MALATLSMKPTFLDPPFYPHTPSLLTSTAADPVV